ncbi:MAG: hypothetical protein ACKO2P_04045 [Planctomycetota bacterium]
MTPQELTRILEKLLASTPSLPVCPDELGLHIRQSLVACSPQDLQQIFRHFSQPDLQLHWEQPPMAGAHCVKSINVQLKPLATGLEPVLWICPPSSLHNSLSAETLQQASLSNRLRTRWKLAFTAADSEPESWWLSQLQPAAAPGLWTARFELRLPEELKGRCLWKFRLCFHQSWMHPLLHPLYETDYTLQITPDASDPQTLEIEADEFSNVAVNALAGSRFRHVKIRAGKNAVVYERPPEPDYNHILGLKPTDTPPPPPPQGLTLTPSLRPVLGQSVPRVLTRRNVVNTAHQRTRSTWQGTRTAELQFFIPTEGTAQRQLTRPALRLHAGGGQSRLRLGRRAHVTDAAERLLFCNDIETRFASDDFTPPASAQELRQYNSSISSANSELEVTQTGIVIRNTGTPDSNFAGRTAVEYRLDGAAESRQLSIRNEAVTLDTGTFRCQEILLRCGGDSPPGRPAWPGLPLQLIPISFWRDAQTNGLPDPDSYEAQIGKLHTSAKFAEDNRIDALLVKHALPSRAADPLHVLLTRQLWILPDGHVCERTDLQDPGLHAALRIVAAKCESGPGSVFLVQRVHPQLTLEISSSDSHEPVCLRRLDFAPLTPMINSP